MTAITYRRREYVTNSFRLNSQFDVETILTKRLRKHAIEAGYTPITEPRADWRQLTMTHIPGVIERGDWAVEISMEVEDGND